MTKLVHASSTRRLRRAAGLLVALGLAVAAFAAPAGAAPTASAAHTATAVGKGPIGWDTYRRLDRMPELPSGVQTRQFSSFDRTGGNNDGFDGKYACLQTTSDGCVIAQHSGPGEVDSIWFTRDNGDVRGNGDITVQLDGKVVLHAPLQDVVDGKIGAPFVYPLVANADQSSGGVYIKVPMPFRSSMKIWTTNNAVFNHVDYRVFADSDGVSTFDPADKAADVIAKLTAAGTADPKPAMPGARIQSRGLQLAPGKSTVVANEKGAGTISALKLSLPQLVSEQEPWVTDDGRAFGAGGYSQFTVKIDPNNTGVRLTRRLAPNIGNQVADVLVDGTKVATWAPLPAVGGAWEDQSVELPASATAGRSSITVRNAFVSSDLDFNEFTYWVDSHVGGTLARTDTVDVGPDHTADETAHAYSILKQTYQGSGTNLVLSTPEQNAAVASSDALLAGLRLRITFDGQRTVDAPLGEFFGTGLGFYPVRSLMFGADTKAKTLSAWWAMPYAKSATVALYNGSSVPVTTGGSAVTAAPGNHLGADTGYFRATSHRGTVVNGKDWDFLATQGRGKFVGESQSMIGNIPDGNLRDYLEGDERVYVDGSRSPQLHGTGTEDFYESGWYFNRNTYTNPMNGNTGHELEGLGCKYDCTGAYRLTLAEAPAFDSSIKFGIEHGPGDADPATYGSTAYWYGLSGLTQKWTDEVDVGNAASEQSHAYSSGGAVSSLDSTFEGNDGPAEPVTDDLRASTTPVTFQLALDPSNSGVVLRRISDQNVGYQSADVTVDGKSAGTWLQPLANTTHRWLDDTYRLPAGLTAGKKSITVRLTPTSGSPAWTAARYDAGSVVAPFTDGQAPGAVTGLTAAGGTSNAITLGWKPARDDVYAPSYQVYASQDRNFTAGPATLVGTADNAGFVHSGLGLKQTWYYRVRAIDAAGHPGKPSPLASATTGTTLRLEAESLLPAVESTATVSAQGDCCGINWSGGAQLWFQPQTAGQHVTLAFTVPTAGTYDFHIVQTKAQDYGINTIALDGTGIGDPYDAYNSPAVEVSDPIDYGQHALTAGRHTLTLTVPSKNAAALNYLAGIDYLDLSLVG